MSNLTKSTLRQGSCQDELMSHFEVRNYALFIRAIEMILSQLKKLTFLRVGCWRAYTRRDCFSASKYADLLKGGVFGGKSRIWL